MNKEGWIASLFISFLVVFYLCFWLALILAPIFVVIYIISKIDDFDSKDELELAFNKLSIPDKQREIARCVNTFLLSIDKIYEEYFQIFEPESKYSLSRYLSFKSYSIALMRMSSLISYIEKKSPNYKYNSFISSEEIENKTLLSEITSRYLRGVLKSRLIDTKYIDTSLINYKILTDLKEAFSDFELYRKELKEIYNPSLVSQQISDIRDDYIIVDGDYKRNSDVDKMFMSEFKGHLFFLYGNKCCQCGDIAGLEVDHFVFPKSYGGNFLMKRVDNDSEYVLNAVPLCKECNVRKLNHDYRTFFSKSTLSQIYEKNKILQDLINNKICVAEFEYLSKK